MATPLRNAIFGRCPRCGGGRLFVGFLKVASACDNCDLDFSGQDSADGPAVFIMMIVGFIVAGLALWVELAYEPPVWLHLVLWVPTILFLSIGALRPLKGLFIGVQYKYRSIETTPGEE